MEKKIRKRKLEFIRGWNWVNEDKHLLTELVMMHVSAIERKRIGKNAVLDKAAAWQDIVPRFNSSCIGAQRNVSQLKTQWKTIKKQEQALKTDLWNEIVAAKKGDENDDASAGVLPNNGAASTENSVDIHGSDINLIKNENQSSEDELMQEGLSISTDDEEDDGQEEQNKDKTFTKAERLASIEIRCRKELHAIQMENEKKISKNLDLKRIMLEQKIKYYIERNKQLPS